MPNRTLLTEPVSGAQSAEAVAASTTASGQAGVDAFSAQALEKFSTYMETSKSRRIFDATRRLKYRNWLLSPGADVDTNRVPKRQIAKMMSEKQHCLKMFCLVNNQVYRKIEGRFDQRVVACTYDAADHIIRAHKEILHAGNRKTHQKVSEAVYGISEDDVEALLPSCQICMLNRPSNTRAPLKPIRTKRVLERVQIDLIDFRHTPDSYYKWIAHIKDHLSKFSALFAQTSKEASGCATNLHTFIKFLGSPDICQSDNDS